MSMTSIGLEAGGAMAADAAAAAGELLEGAHLVEVMAGLGQEQALWGAGPLAGELR
jgi:hypothetical protein